MNVEKRARELVKQMTVEEQAAQLKYASPPIERLGLSAYNWWNEGLHGVARAGTATVFPQAIALAAMFDEQTLFKVAEVIAEEARAKYNVQSENGDFDIYKGLTLWSPNVNIFRDERWGRGHETYGEDPFLTSRLGVAFVKGLQGDGEILKTAACAKHFAVHSGPENQRHSFNAKVSEKDLEETYLPAFEALVKEARVEGVMGAYNRVNGEASCASDYLMAKLEEWGFDGYFVSDCWALQDFHMHHGITANAIESAALALKAGCVINCGSTYLHILAALRDGLVTEQDIENACVKAMKTRIRLGMLDEKTPFDDIPYTVVSCEEHKNLALECAEKSITLLRNNQILPLNRKKVKSIACIGPNANSRSCLVGNYEGTCDRYETILEGIQDEFEGRIFYSEGCHLYKDRMQGLALPDDRYAEAVACVENSDACILCLGLDATLEGEEGDTGNEYSSGDKADLSLPLSQRKLLKRVLSAGKPVIVVVCAGSAINIGEDCDALIHAWYPGQRGGKALAKILFGDVSPSGKLPVTFYKDTSLLPDFEDYSMDNRTYRYTRENILYPFGYGLTYSRIVCSSVSYDGIAKVNVKNIGEAATDEVIELYIMGEKDCFPRYPRLCGFKRVFLYPGEEKCVEIEVLPSQFTSVNEKGERAVFSKSFTLYAGTSQPDELSEKLTGIGCASCKIFL